MVPEPDLNPQIPPPPPPLYPPPPSALGQPEWMAPPLASAPMVEAPVVAVRPEPLPVEPREYHQFYRAPANRWWKPLVAFALFAVAWVIVGFIIVIPLVIAQIAAGKPVTNIEDLASPEMFIANNLLLAAAIPLSLFTHWLVFRQRPRWLSSLVGGFRWGMFWQFLGLAGVPMIAFIVIELALTGGFAGLSWNSSSLFLLVGILVTTPLQCAGEEYSHRGLLGRAVGSWFRSRWVALAVGTAVSSTVFMLLHGAGDVWLNFFYFGMGVLFSALTWRTGGLEAAIAMHIANNLVSESTLPFDPAAMAGIFNRQAGVAGPEMLFQVGVILLMGGLIWWRASRLPLVRAAAPGNVPPADTASWGLVQH